LFAKGKTGKSLVVLEMAACITAGVPFAGLDVERSHVLYVDKENDPGDIIDRLKTMGFTPGQLDWLHYKSFPPLPGLDSNDGGHELLELALRHDVALVVLDTMARTVNGPENDADTYRDYATRTGTLLKAAGIAVIRLDHAGADTSRGQRGSTAKNDDVDVVWELKGRGDDVQQWTLAVWDHRKRYRQGLDSIRLHRGPDRRLHQPTASVTVLPTLAVKLAEVVAAMDALDLPLEWGRKRLGTALRQKGHPAGNDLIDAAKHHRRQRAADAEKVPGHLDAPGTLPGTPDAAPLNAVFAAPVPYRPPTGTGTTGHDGGGCRTTPPPLRVGGPGTSPPAPPEGLILCPGCNEVHVLEGELCGNCEQAGAA
jgi:hypothetical protein